MSLDTPFAGCPGIWIWYNQWATFFSVILGDAKWSLDREYINSLRRIFKYCCCREIQPWSANLLGSNHTYKPAKTALHYHWLAGLKWSSTHSKPELINWIWYLIRCLFAGSVVGNSSGPGWQASLFFESLGYRYGELWEEDIPVLYFTLY